MRHTLYRLLYVARPHFTAGRVSGSEPRAASPGPFAAHCSSLSARRGVRKALSSERAGADAEDASALPEKPKDVLSTSGRRQDVFHASA